MGTELEKLSKFELAKLGTLELAKLRRSPDPVYDKTSSRYLHLFRITFTFSQYKYCDRKTLNPKIIIYPIGRSQNVKKTTKKAEKKRKILFRIKTDCDHSIVMKSSNLSSYLDELRELVSSDFFHQKSYVYNTCRRRNASALTFNMIQ